MSRGIKNNNPGNIKISSNAWNGKIPIAQNTDGTFEQFETMALGVRAMSRLLKNYVIKSNMRTLEEMINRYAPPVENNTSAYVLAVSRALGVSPTESSMNIIADPVMFEKLVKAIIRHENGVDIPLVDFKEGLRLASL